MTSRPGRAVAMFVAALVVLSGLVYLAQQTIYVRPPVQDLTPASDGPSLAAAPVDRPVRTTTARGGARDAGVPQVDPAWLQRTADRAGLPVTALEAYARAELSAPASCGIGWTTLAGIGWIESQHGTLGGRVLGSDGRSDPLILGPALDGKGPVAAIRASAQSTQWHGDPDWDHAVGPMQFIPSTWETWAADGDGDGAADPNDIDDAALAAADYLCADGRDLTTGVGWTGGVFAYNHAQSYVDSVHAAATEYAARTA